LLGAQRGSPPADVESLVHCLETLADFAHAERAHIEEIDLNPIVVRPAGRGCVVVDALIVPAR
jgi:acetate---CoA ligase (ADP-forming)